MFKPDTAYMTPCSFFAEYHSEKCSVMAIRNALKTEGFSIKRLILSLVFPTEAMARLTAGEHTAWACEQQRRAARPLRSILLPCGEREVAYAFDVRFQLERTRRKIILGELRMFHRAMPVLLALVLSLAITPAAVAQEKDKPGNPRKPDGTMRDQGDPAGQNQIYNCLYTYSWTRVTSKGAPGKGTYARREVVGRECSFEGPAGMVE